MINVKTVFQYDLSSENYVIITKQIIVDIKIQNLF